jgi:hypothetical protein
MASLHARLKISLVASIATLHSGRTRNRANLKVYCLT